MRSKAMRRELRKLLGSRNGRKAGTKIKNDRKPKARARLNEIAGPAGF